MKSMKLGRQKYISLFVFSFALAFFIASHASAQTAQSFYVSKNYDLYGRNEIDAVLVKSSDKLYWYAEKDWWNSPSTDRSVYLAKIDELTSEFENKIYPILTSKFGSEWNPGIDNNSRMTILLHQMKKDVSGYWRSDDEYYTLQGVASSNQREMIYLNGQKLQDSIAKSNLAHEFTHLIVFNQKEKQYGVQEDLWLQEMLAEMSSSVLGYNDVFPGSILEQRLKTFLTRPTDSLTEWNGELTDYGTVYLFGQYLLDHYGWQVLAGTLKTQAIGINAVNDALSRGGFNDRFSDVFTNWMVALAVNECLIKTEYCYLNSGLAKVKITPSIYFLPLSGDTTISITLQAKNWAANWYKFIGGHDTLGMDFNAPKNINTRIIYIIELPNNKFQIRELALNKDYSTHVEFADFGKNILSMILIPTIQDNRFDDSLDIHPSYALSWALNLKGSGENMNTSPNATGSTIIQLQQRIAELKAQIAVLQARLASIKGSAAVSSGISCQNLSIDLYYGMSGPDVSCLQSFLKQQGQEIYPEGLMTGNFFGLTKAAVVRFQEKHESDILAPIGLTNGTGFVGSLTRAKINLLMAR